jgi:hypothetical protein
MLTEKMEDLKRGFSVDDVERFLLRFPELLPIQFLLETSPNSIDRELSISEKTTSGQPEASQEQQRGLRVHFLLEEI